MVSYVSCVSCLASTNSYRGDTYKTVRHFHPLLMVARSDFWFLKNRKAKKTPLGGGIIPTALIVKVNKNSRQDEPALLHERR